MEKSSEYVRLGIAGMGAMGVNHAKRILKGQIKNLHLTAVSDVDASRLEAYSDIATFTDFEEMLSSGAIDAVLIATPHYFHTTLGIQALEADVHVLVEKPISVHKADCERLIAAHKDKNQVFAAMFNQRTDPRYQKVRELIASGEIGEVRRVNWIITDWYRTEAYYSGAGWRATWKGEGGGVLMNQCPHQLDLLCWMFGAPKKVRAFCEFGKFHDIEVEDSVTAYMEFPNGATGVFVTTTGEAPGTNRLEIAADRGRLIIEAGSNSIKWLRNEVDTTEHLKSSSRGFEKPKTWSIEIPLKGTGPQHDGILENFTQAIIDGSELLAPAAEGIHSVELTNAMLYSSFKDVTVDMPLDGAAYEAELQKRIDESTFEKKVVEKEASQDDFSGSF